MNRIAVLLLLLAGFLSEETKAQKIDALTAPYTTDECTSCVEWNEPQSPFQVHLNTYYVGTRGLAAVLIASEDGHILIDAGLPNSAPLIMENVRSLGFDVEDIDLILNTHAHFDHAGGIAAIQKVSGARVAASPESAVVLEAGRGGPSDPQYGVLLDYPSVGAVESFEPGDTLHVGRLSVRSHATAGHTPGGTSWSWEACHSEKCLNIVYADSQTPVSADGFRFSDSDHYPSAIDDFKKGHRTLEQLTCDILITTHPSASQLWERIESGPHGLVDPNACREYADRAREQLRNRLQREANHPTSEP